MLYIGTLVPLQHTSPTTTTFNYYLDVNYKMWFFIRWTSDYTTKEELARKFKRYVVSKEYSKRSKLHYHLVVDIDLESKTDVQNFMYDNFKHDRRGICTLKVDVVGPHDHDLSQCSTYTVKDGDYIFSEFFADKIEKYVANSHAKPTTVVARVQEAIDFELENDTPNYRNMWMDIARIKSEAGLEVYPNKISARVLGVMISQDIQGDLLNYLVNKEKIFSLD